MKYRLIILAMLPLVLLFMTGCKPKHVQQESNNHPQTGTNTSSKEDEKPRPVDKKDLTSSELKHTTSHAQIALLVDDFGYVSGDLLQEFCALDRDVSFAIIPGMPHSVTAMKKGVAAGHETIIHAPMQPDDYPKTNPGANALLVSMTPDQIKDRMESFINELPYCIGVNNHMGSAFTSDETAMTAIMKVLKKHDLFFIDSATTPNSVVSKVGRQYGVPAARRRLFLDVPDTSEENTSSKLQDLQKLSTGNSTIIVITHCHNTSKLTQIRSFMKQAKALGYDFVPISDAMSAPAINL